MKSGKGVSTGVNLRFHTLAECTNFTHPQQREFKAWRITPERRAALKSSKAQRNENNNNYLPKYIKV